MLRRRLKLWLNIIGGVLLLLGLLSAFLSTKKQFHAIGEWASLGIATYAPEKPEIQRKRQDRTQADTWFNIGLVSTSLGIIFQTISGLLPDKSLKI